MSAGKVDPNPNYEIWQFHSGKCPARINHYVYDQDLHKVEIVTYVKGAEQYPRKNLKAKFESRSLHFKLENNSPDVEVNLVIDKLAHEINPSKSTFKVVPEDQIVITLSKFKPQIWESLIFVPDVIRKSWIEEWRKFLRAATDPKIDDEVMEKEVKHQWNLSECIYTDDINFYLNPPSPYGPIPVLQDVKTINEVIGKLKTYIKTKQQWLFKADLLGAAILYKLMKTHKESQTTHASASSSSVKTKKLEKNVLIKEPNQSISSKTGERPSKYTFVPAADIKRFRGNELFEKGDYKEAIHSYTEAIKIDSLCPTYYNKRAACYLNLGKYQEAMDDAYEAISMDPSSAEAYYYKGKAAFLCGKILEGTMDLSIALKLDPLSPNIDIALQQRNCMRLAKMVEKCTKRIENGRRKEGKKLFSELMKYCKVELVVLKKNLYEDLCRANLSCSVEFLAALDLDENLNDFQAVYYLMKCYFYQNLKEDALTFIYSVSSPSGSHYAERIFNLKDNIENFYLLVEKGDRAFERKDLTEAQNCYLQAVDIDPLNKNSNLKLQYKIGECRMQQKDYEQAAKYFSVTLKGNDSHQEAREKLKECLKYLKKYKKDANHEVLSLLADAEDTNEHCGIYKDVENKLKISHGTQKANEKLATSKFVEGQEYQLKKQYELAIDCYSEAIAAEHDNDKLVSLYVKRSQCHYELENFRQAYLDAVSGGRLETDNIEACLQMGKCCIALADSLREAESMLTIAYNLDRFNDYNITNIGMQIRRLQALTSLICFADKAFAEKNYADASKKFKEALNIAIGSNELKLKRAECLISLDNFKEAETISASMASSGNDYPEHKCLLGMLSYHRGDLNKAIIHLKRAQEISHIHHKSIELKGKAEGLLKIKNEGSKAFAKGNLRTALSLYKTAVKIDPLNKFLTSLFHFNIGVILLKQKNLPNAIEAFSSAITIRDNHLLAYLKRAECYMESGRKELAVEDYEKVCELFPSVEHDKLLQNAKKL